MRLYLDTAPVIYTVEQVNGFAAAVDERLAMSEVVLIASDLTRMECRVKPLREGNTDLLKDFDDFFADAVAEIAVLSRPIMIGRQRFEHSMVLKRLTRFILLLRWNRSGSN